jgi:hypothetical protein
MQMALNYLVMRASKALHTSYVCDDSGKENGGERSYASSAELLKRC